LCVHVCARVTQDVAAPQPGLAMVCGYADALHCRIIAVSGLRSVDAYAKMRK
jgi:hypothetical protein